MPRTIVLTVGVTVTLLTSGPAASGDVRLKPDATQAAPTQAFPAPTRTPSASTPAQDKAIEAGIDLHDAGKFDEAIARYEEVLKENPDNMTALFELAYSQTGKKDYQKSLASARRGTEFKSDLLPMFYDVMASTLDLMGQPEQAIEAYKRGIELVPGASSLYYNMAVTYHETLKNSDAARAALKQAATLDPAHAESQLLLGQLFRTAGYHPQALLAFSRYLIIEPAGGRSLQAYGLWRSILRGETDPTMAAAGAPKSDEGDFTAVDTVITSSHAVLTKALDEGKPEASSLVTQLDTVIARLTGRDAATDRGSFTGAMYVPYFVELKGKNYVEPFVYWISQRAPVPGVKEWIVANPVRVREFLNWSEAYKWPAGLR